MANPLREILARFAVDTKSVEDGVKKSQGLIGRLTEDLKGLATGLAGAFAVKSIVGFAQAVLAETDANAKLAESLGIGVRELQGWQYAADQSGVAAGMLTMTISKLQKATADAAAGQGAAALTFKRLGIQAKLADGQLRPVSDVLEDVVTKLQGMEDVTARNALLIQMFGGQGLALVPLLNAGTDGIAEMREEVEALGFAISDDFAAEAQDFSTEMTRMKMSFRGLMVQTLRPLLPLFIEVTQAVTAMVKPIVALTKSTGEWLRQTKFLQAGLALLTLKALPALVAWLGKGVAGVGGLRGAFMRLLPLLWKVIAPALILEDLFVFLAGGQSAFGATLNKIFGEGSAESFRDSVLEILTMLKDGKIGEALSRSLEGASVIFAAIGEQMMKGFIALWNAIVDKSGKLGTMLGLSKIEPGELDVDRESTYEREARKADRIRSGEESVEERAQREVLVPGAQDVVRGLESLGTGAAGMLGQAPMILQRDEDGNLSLQALAQAAENVQGWVEEFPNHVELDPAMRTQDVTNSVEVRNTINIQVPPGTDTDMARRVGTAAASGAQRGIDTRQLFGALVVQPAR